MKRLALRALLFLLLGAVINVAVAWGCGLWIETPPAAYFKVVDVNHNPLTRLTPEPWLAKPEGILRVIYRETPSAGLIVEELNIEARHSLNMLYRQQSGWPFPALECHALVELGSGRHGPRKWLWGVESSHMFRPHRDHHTYFSFWRPISLLPVLPGFVFNTIIFGVASVMVVGLLESSRRLARSARGLCPCCAYPAGPSPICPERGKPVKPQQEAPA